MIVFAHYSNQIFLIENVLVIAKKEIADNGTARLEITYTHMSVCTFWENVRHHINAYECEYCYKCTDVYECFCVCLCEYAGMFNWIVAVPPDTIKSKLQSAPEGRYPVCCHGDWNKDYTRTYFHQLFVLFVLCDFSLHS